MTHDDSVDDVLLSNFFADSRAMHVADDGFADSVMQRIAEAATAGQPAYGQAAVPAQPELISEQAAVPAQPEAISGQAAAPAEPELISGQAAAPAEPELMPWRQRFYYALWSVACAVACVAVFVFSDGLDLLKSSLHAAVASVVASLSVQMPALPHISLPHLNLAAADMWHVGMATPFVVTLVLIVVGSLTLYDLKES